MSLSCVLIKHQRVLLNINVKNNEYHTLALFPIGGYHECEVGLHS